MRNLLVRVPSKPQAVFVRCAECNEFVARYKLSDYYHHGKGAESYMRSHGSGAADSGRRILKEFSKVVGDAEKEFAEVMEQFKKEGKAE